MTEDWAALEDHITPNGRFAPPERESAGQYAKTQKFPCPSCGGSGKYRGVRVHQMESKCFACGGKGHFMTSEQDRRDARQKAAARKLTKLRQAREAFDEQHPGVGEFVISAAGWSSFARELADKLAQYGALTDGQTAAVCKMMATVTARRAAERQIIDLSPIRAMFETARGNGYKAPVYRAGGLVITRAPDHGKNPGALYIKTEGDEYLGKIVGTEYSGKPAPALMAIAADPRGEAIRHGQRTGNCSCCGRMLTRGASIDAGIGPICASKWGL